MKTKGSHSTGHLDLKSGEGGPVNFRLDEAHLDLLMRRAAAFNISHHQLAREFLIQFLHEAEERAAIRDSMLAILGELRELRKDVSLASETLLVSAGHVSEKDAQKWAAENLLPR